MIDSPTPSLLFLYRLMSLFDVQQIDEPLDVAVLTKNYKLQLKNFFLGSGYCVKQWEEDNRTS
jgi:hypothetical protein